MTIYSLLMSFWLLFILLAISVALFLIILGLLKLGQSVLRWFDVHTHCNYRLLWSGLPLSLVGIVSGYLTGLSRAPAVTALVPGVLTLVGAFALYLVGKERDHGATVGVAVVSFSLSILIGATIGSDVRSASDAASNSLEYLRHVSEDEFLLNLYRKGMGLPPASLLPRI